MARDPHTDPDMIQALELDPENELLLVEYALQTGGVQLGLTNSGGGPALPQIDAADSLLEIAGIGGGPIAGELPINPQGGPDV